MKNIIFVVVLLMCNTAFGESYSDVSTIKGLTVGSGYARVKLNQMKPAENCESGDYYYLNAEVNKEVFSTVLAAKASGQKLSFQLIGCHGNMAKISHVYLCDTEFCQ